MVKHKAKSGSGWTLEGPMKVIELTYVPRSILLSSNKVPSGEETTGKGKGKGREKGSRGDDMDVDGGDDVDVRKKQTGKNEDRLNILVGLGDGKLYQATLAEIQVRTQAATRTRSRNGEEVVETKLEILESRLEDLGERPVRVSYCRLGSSSSRNSSAISSRNRNRSYPKGKGKGKEKNGREKDQMGMGDGWGVFACGSRGTIVHWEKGRAKHSPLTLKVCLILLRMI